MCKNLVAPEDTYYIEPFSFGDKPKSDECDIYMNCITDEILGSTLNDYNRWFEVIL